MELVSIGRGTAEAKLFDTKGGIVTLYTSATVDQSDQAVKKHGMNGDQDTQLKISIELIIACFVEWNLGENGTPLPCTAENLRKLSQRDFLVILQTCTGRELVSPEGRIYIPDEIEKKGKSA